MKQNVNLLEGSIVKGLSKLAFPIMGTSLIQMAYNLTDMIWIGRVSSNAVAAVGAAGMYLWLANGIATIPRLGGQVKAAHALGAGRKEEAAAYGRAALHMGVILTLLCTAVYLIANRPLIDFFNLNHESVVRDARDYLIIVGAGLVFSFFNQIFTGLFTAMGNSIVTFRSTAVGLVANIVLDPLFIFGLGPIPRMEVAGAAIATVLAQAIVFVMFLLAMRKDSALFSEIHFWRKSRWDHWKGMIQIGLPVAVQNIIFSSLSMIIARLIAGWGDAAVAVQKVGSQIESISWMTADGFATAVNAFVAQNFGAKKRERIRRGYYTAMGLMAGWGVFTSFVLIVFPEVIFRIFITEQELLPMGVDYLRILGVSQLFMCMEITSAGAFQGIGKPLPPTVVGIAGNAARIPMAIALSATALGLNGIWWSISISSIVKGLIVPVWFILLLRGFLKRMESPAVAKI